MKILYLNRPDMKFMVDSSILTWQEGRLNPCVAVDTFKFSIEAKGTEILIFKDLSLFLVHKSLYVQDYNFLFDMLNVIIKP